MWNVWAKHNYTILNTFFCAYLVECLQRYKYWKSSSLSYPYTPSNVATLTSSYTCTARLYNHRCLVQGWPLQRVGAELDGPWFTTHLLIPILILFRYRKGLESILERFDTVVKTEYVSVWRNFYKLFVWWTDSLFACFVFYLTESLFLVSYDYLILILTLMILDHVYNLNLLTNKAF